MVFRIRKEGEASFPFDIDKTFNAIPLTLSKLGWKIRTIDPTLYRISARIGVSLWTWGQNVFIVVNKVDKSNSVVHISSETTHQIIDWGKNRRDIDKFFNELESNLGLTYCTHCGKQLAIKIRFCYNCGKQIYSI